MRYIISSEIQPLRSTLIFNEILFVTWFSKPKDKLSKNITDYTSVSRQKSEAWLIPDCQSFNIINKSYGISDLEWYLSSLDQLPVQCNFRTFPEKKDSILPHSINQIDNCEKVLLVWHPHMSW